MSEAPLYGTPAIPRLPLLNLLSRPFGSLATGCRVASSNFGPTFHGKFTFELRTPVRLVAPTLNTRRFPKRGACLSHAQSELARGLQ